MKMTAFVQGIMIKCFTFIISFNLYNPKVGALIYIPRWKHWGLDGLSNIWKITMLISNRARFWRDSFILCCLQNLSLESPLNVQKHWYNTMTVQFSSVQSLSHVQLFVTPWIAARQASLSITNSRSSLRLTSIESVMPSSHLILCRSPSPAPPIPPSIRVFSNESTLRIRWPKY